MFLERIVGRDVTNPVSAKGFHDVHYLRQMLYCVFKSLHQAQRKLAFHHADLRLANIMELMPENQKGSSPSTPTGTGTPRSGRMQDASHHDSQHVSGVLHPDDLAAVNLREVARQPQAASPSGDQYPSSLQEATAQTRAHDPVLAHKSASMATMEAEGTGDLQDGHFKVRPFPFLSEWLSQQQGSAKMLLFCSFLIQFMHCHKQVHMHPKRTCEWCHSVTGGAWLVCNTAILASSCCFPCSKSYVMQPVCTQQLCLACR